MKQRAATVTKDVLAHADIECTHCGVMMSSYQTQASGMRYFRCGCCHRWVSSAYADVLAADAKVKAQPRRAAASASPRLDAVKDRLEKWLAALEGQDPYRILGVSPHDSADLIRRRYRELAMVCHPDRGGSPERMRELNAAYERITHHLERRSADEMGGGELVPARGR